MPGRDLVVRIRADVTDFQAKMRLAKAGVSQFNTDLAKSSAKRQALNDIGNGFGRIGLLAAAGAGAAIKSFADFDQAMSSVQAALPRTSHLLDELRDKAMKAGAATKFSATEAAAGIEELVKAGVSAEDVLSGGLDAALNLAAADGLSVADAAQITATALNQFKLAGTDATHVADRLAGTAYAAQGGVTDMAEALNYVGPVAQSMGLDIDDTTAAIGLLAKQGILGSQAGTSLRAVLLSMSGAGRSSKKTLDGLGISLADSKGKFIGFAPAVDRLNKALEGKTDQEKTNILTKLFGREGVTAALNFLDAGSKGIGAMNDEISNQASAAGIASTKMDNLKGDWEQLRGSLETALIGSGSGGNSGLRELLQDVRGLVDVFNELPQPVQGATTKALLLTAALGGGLFVVSRTITGYANMKSSLSTLGFEMGTATRKSMLLKGGIGAAGLGLMAFSDTIGKETSPAVGGLANTLGAAAIGFSVGGPWGAAVGAGASLIGSFAKAQGDAARDVDSLRDTLDQQTGALTNNTRAFVANKLEKSGALAAGRRLGINQTDLVDASLGDPAAQGAVNRRLDKGFSGLPAGDPAASQMGRDLSKVTAAMGTLSAQTDKARASQKQLNQAVFGLKSTTVERVAAATRGIPKSVVLKMTTPGAPNAINATAKLLANTKATPKDIRLALKLAGWKDQKDIEAVVTKTEALRKKPKTDQKLTVEARKAISDLQTILDSLAGIKSKEVTVTTHYETTGKPPGTWTGGRVRDSFAGGGRVPGVGPSSGADNVLAHDEFGRGLAVRSREWIINEKQSDLNDRYLRAINAGADFNKILPGFAGGRAPGGDGAAAVPMIARLVNPTLRIEGDGLVRLIDARVEIGVDDRASHAASRSRAGH